MNLRRLKYFVKIIDIGSLTQAADVLHIAQPALSQQLATLESEVGQKLVHLTSPFSWSGCPTCTPPTPRRH